MSRIDDSLNDVRIKLSEIEEYVEEDSVEYVSEIISDIEKTLDHIENEADYMEDEVIDTGEIDSALGYLEDAVGECVNRIRRELP